MKEYHKKLQTILTRYDELVKKCLKGYNATENTPFYEIVFSNILKRHCVNISAINTLLFKNHENHYVKMPIALIMRSLLLDNITFLYFNAKLENYDEQKFKMEFARLNKESVKEYNDFVNQQKKTEKEKLNKILIKSFPENFKKDEKQQFNEKIKSLGAKEMFNTINKIYSAEFIKNLNKSSYYNYLFYSKYDHFSMKSIHIIEYPLPYEFDKLIVSSYNVLQVDEWILKKLKIETNKIEELGSIIEQFKDF